MKSARTKMTRACGQLSLVALAIVASPFAAADDDAGWYAGANVGATRATIDDARILRGLSGRGFTTSSPISVADNSNGYKIFGGYRLNKYLAVEGGYFDLGEFGFNATTTDGTLNGNIKLRGLNLDLVGSLPITNRFSVFGSVGANHAEATDSFTGTGRVHVLNPSPSQRETNLKLGLGVEYALSERLGLRAELERYRISDAVGNKGDIDMASVGLTYRFGAKSPAPVARAVMPEPVALAPAVQPVFVQPAAPPPAPPPPPMPAKVTFSADSLFEFDKATVTPAGQEELRRFAAQLSGTRYDVITVIGHTDRIGSHAYNLKLSDRRAESVKSYLVGSAGIAPDRIATKGVDGADPVTKPGECRGNKVSKALIACLQPDRRVDVEVSGMR